MLTERTERDYRQYVNRWERDGQPGPVAWVAMQSSPATRRNARAALVSYHRVELGRTLTIPHVPQVRRVPKALSDDELALLRTMALGVHPRCRPSLDLLYTTGARLQEHCGVRLEDVSETHIVRWPTHPSRQRNGGLVRGQHLRQWNGRRSGSEAIGRAILTHVEGALRPREMRAETDADAVDFRRVCNFEVTSLGEQYPGVERFRCIRVLTP